MATSKLDNDDDSDADVEEFDVNAVDGPVTLHYASTSLKASVDNYGYQFPFPHCAQSTTLDQFYATVPAELLNFIAVITGLVKDVDNFLIKFLFDPIMPQNFSAYVRTL